MKGSTENTQSKLPVSTNTVNHNGASNMDGALVQTHSDLRRACFPSAMSCHVPQDCMPWPILFNQFLVAFFLLSFLNLLPFLFLLPLLLSVFYPCLAQENTK